MTTQRLEIALRALSFALVSGALLTGCGPQGAALTGPDVVLITLDTTRADYLSCYGYPRETTPTLDALAAEGTRFDLAVSTAGVTPVSHASILTGRFNRDHEVRVLMAGSGFRLPDSVPTLGTAFADAGYFTLTVHSAFPVSPHYGLDRGFEVVKSFQPKLGQGGQKGIEAAARRSDTSIDLTVEALEREAAGRDRPFFLWLHLWDPHDWVQLPPDEFLPDREALLAEYGGTMGPEARARWTLEVYAAEVQYMDAQIGRLVEHLRARGRLDDTLFAITADHGQGLEDHDWAMHRILYQEQIRVPLIVRPPSSVAGLEPVPARSELVRTVDIAPTLLDLAGLEPDSTMSARMAGRSLRGLMRGDDAEPGTLAFAEQINGYDLSADMVAKRPHDDFSYCVLDKDWKLVWRPNHPDLSELFHLAEDPGELTNAWAWDHPEALRLKRELGRHAPWVTEPFPLETAGSSNPEGFEAALAQLGYTGQEGESSGPEWEYVCPEDYERRAQDLKRCDHCEAPMILIAKGK